ncbi:MAG: energy transducer TonB [Bacteroidota bacterium]|nr:energy transducer TonB [Bacteroidota bacterium]MDX5447991.1 energy transducer TonB [Bacteroidota bacterium]
MAKNFKDLREKYRQLFFWVGLVIALFLVLLAFQWRTYYQLKLNDPVALSTLVEEDPIPQTFREPEKKKSIVSDPKPGDEEPGKEVEPEPKKIAVIDFGSEDGTDSLDHIPNIRIQDDEPIPVFDVANKPIFPGCEDEMGEDARLACMNLKMREFINKEATYPEVARTLRTQEKIYVSFVIGTDGEVQDVKIARGTDESLKSEAMRVIRKLPKMKPAMQAGRKVPVTLTIPVDFKLH